MSEAFAVVSPPPRLGAACLVLLVMSTLAHQFWPLSGAVWITGAAAALFLALEHRRIPSGIRRVALAVGSVSILALPFSATPLASTARGIAIGGIMVALISSVTLLARAALTSPHIHAVARFLLTRGVRARYACFSIAGLLFGGLLGMAGVTLLLQMAAGGDAAAEEDRLAMFSAITRSFAAATLWSPMVSNLTILVALYPGVRWSTVVPLTMALAAGAVVIGTSLDLWRLRHRGALAPSERSQPFRYRTLAPPLLAMAGFLGMVMLAANLLHITVTVTIVILVPVAVLLLYATQAGGSGPRRLARSAALLKADVQALPALAGEVTLFMVAGCGGTIIASAIPHAWTNAIGSALSHSPTLACLALMLIIIGLSFMAVHAVLSAVLVASLLPPELLHLAPVPHLAAILVGWSLSACATPFSMMALMASRYSGFPVQVVTVRVNRVYALLCIGIAAPVLGLASQWLRTHS